MSILDLFKPIRLFVFDVDGVLTDGTIHIFENGNFTRKMSVRDGYALQLAVRKGYDIMVISGSDAEAVVVRMNKLGVTNVFMKVTDKLACLKKYIAEKNYDVSQVLFMGDDIPDIEAMQFSGLPCCPADAAYEVREIVKYISPFRGGETCVRDVIEKVMKLNRQWQHVEDIASS
ncbi:MAG TPA: HAD hydrolase family protein [Flavitalea sp.]|nr:HAD hydrolase family protein [Flavitalea sp.]